MDVFAHRGASSKAPENTLSAMRAALIYPVAGIEVDLRCADGAWFLFHDRRLERTTSGHGRFHDHDAATLRALTSASGEPLPYLEELFATVAGRCALNLELKEEGDLNTLEKLLRRACQQYGFTPEQLIISSFDHHLLAAIAARGWPYPRAALFGSLPLTLAADAAALGCEGLHIDYEVITPALVYDCHRRDIKIRVYTVDDPVELRELAAMGVDAVFANDPGQALVTLASHQA